MKIKKHVRRGSLAALIALALTSSALAMPTGGVVQSGDVNIGGSTDFSTVTDNATITAGTDSTINWNTFNIASGETLNFNIADGKLLLNQVTGAQASDILGTMNQTGKGSLALVNPNGIHIGQNAVLDVNSLTLSTLGIGTKNDAETLLRQGALGARAITVDQGAQFDIARKLNLFGGQVAVADGVVFNLNNVPDPRESMLEVVAAKELYWQEGSDHDSDLSKWTMERGNTVDFHGTVNALSTGKDAEINIFGYAVNADRAHIDGDRAEITIAAVSKVDDDDRSNASVKHWRAEFSPENVVRADGLRIREKKSTEIRGGKVELKNSTIDTARLGITASSAESNTGDVDHVPGATEHQVITAGKDNSVTLDNVTINGMTPQHGGYHWFEITGGTVNILNSNIHTEKTLNVSAISSLDRTMKNRHWATPIELEGTRTSTAANTLNVTNSTLRVTRPAWESPTSGAVQADLNAKDIKLTGGTVHLTGATIETPLIAQIMAGTTVEREDSPYNQTAHTPSTTELHSLRSTPAHTVTIDGTSMIRSTDVAVGAGKVTVGNDVTFNLGDASGGAMEVVAGSRVPMGETEITTSTTRGNDVEFHGKIQGMTSANHTVDITGATVNLNSAQIGSAGDNGIVNVMAARTTRIKDADHVDIAASAGNAVSAEGLTVNSGKTNVAGGNVALKDSTVQSSSPALIAAVNRLKFDGAEKTATAAKNNVVYMDGAKVKGSDVTTVSGKVQMVDNAEVEGTGDVHLYIGNSIATNAEGKTVTSVTKDNTLDMRGSKLKGDVVDFPSGGAGIYEGSTVTAATKLDNSEVRRTDGSTGVYQRDNTSAVTENGVTENYDVTTEVPPRPAKPVPPPVPESMDAELSAQDEENIDTGRLAAQDALAATSKEEMVASLVKKIAKLNEKVAESPRQTAGIVVGMVKEIAETSALNAADKLDLQRAVLDAYAPVQELKDEQDHHAVRTLADAVRVAENTLVTATTHEHDSSNVQPVTFTD